jgi:hypothetical protein
MVILVVIVRLKVQKAEMVEQALERKPLAVEAVVLVRLELMETEQLRIRMESLVAPAKVHQ